MKDDASLCPTTCPMTWSVFLRNPLVTQASLPASFWKRPASQNQAVQWKIPSGTHLQIYPSEPQWKVSVFSDDITLIGFHRCKHFHHFVFCCYSFWPSLCVDWCCPLCAHIPGVHGQWDSSSDVRFITSETGCGDNPQPNRWLMVFSIQFNMLIWLSIQLFFSLFFCVYIRWWSHRAMCVRLTGDPKQFCAHHF